MEVRVFDFTILPVVGQCQCIAVSVEPVFVSAADCFGIAVRGAGVGVEEAAGACPVAAGAGLSACSINESGSRDNRCPG